MKINILEKIDGVNDVENYIEKRMSSLEKLLGDGDKSCDFRIGKNSGSHKHGKIYFAEVKIVTSSKQYGVRAEGESTNEVIDQVKEELMRKITKYKDKKISLRKKGGAMIKKLLRKIKN